MAFQLLETITAAPLDPSAEHAMVPMRDGVRLATDVYLPGDGKRHPIVFVRTCYDKCGRYNALPYAAPYWNERGYAFVAQDVRGKFRSEGETSPYTHDVVDAYDTIDWITSQPWCDGNVGMWGASYYGYTVWAGAVSKHPALKAIIPQVTMVDLGQLHIASRWREVIDPVFAPFDLVEYWLDNDDYFFEWDTNHRPLIEAWDDAFTTMGKRSIGFDTFVKSVGDGSFKSPYGTAHPYETVDIPVLHWGGWFDILLATPGMADYAALRAHPARAANQYLRMSSTDHSEYSLSDVPITPETDHFTNDAALKRGLQEEIGVCADFFDPFLRRLGEPLNSDSRVRWHLGHMGWRASESWPPPDATELRLFLSDGGAATSSVEGGTLSPSPDRTPTNVQWVHDPTDLVPSTSSMDGAWLFLAEYPDEREVEGRPDVLTFTGDPSDRPLDLAGPMTAFVAVASSSSSMQLHAKLLDVHPDGAAHLIVCGRTLIHGPDPGRLVEVDLGNTAYRLRPGHRLRLHLASSDYPHYVPHPGTGESPWIAVKARTNEQILVTGGTRASYLSISTLPASGG